MVYVPRTKARVGMDEKFITYILGNQQLQDKEQVLSAIQAALEEARDNTIFEVELWIDNNVPMRSGDLIESLKAYLKKSVPPAMTAGELKGIRIVLGAGAEINYTKFVAKMTMSQVRHYNTWLEHSGKKAYSKGSPILLNDPRAEGHFFEKMVDFARERLQVNLAKAKYKLASTTALTSRNLTGLEVTE